MNFAWYVVKKVTVTLGGTALAVLCVPLLPLGWLVMKLIEMHDEYEREQSK